MGRAAAAWVSASSKLGQQRRDAYSKAKTSRLVKLSNEEIGHAIDHAKDTGDDETAARLERHRQDRSAGASFAARLRGIRDADPSEEKAKPGTSGRSALRELQRAKQEAGAAPTAAAPARPAPPRPTATRGSKGLGRNLSAVLDGKRALVDHDRETLTKASREAKAAGMNEVAARLDRHLHLDKALAHLGGVRAAAQQLHNLAALAEATPAMKAVAERFGRASGVKAPPKIPDHVRKASIAAGAAREAKSRGPVNAHEPVPAMKKLDAMRAALQMGPKGGQFYITATGRKVYKRG